MKIGARAGSSLAVVATLAACGGGASTGTTGTTGSGGQGGSGTTTGTGGAGGCSPACGPTEACVAGACLALCDAQGHCPASSHCDAQNPAGKVCVPTVLGDPCTVPTDCPAKAVCQTGTCETDSDGDGVGDPWETACGSDPMSAASMPDPTKLGGHGTAADPYRLCYPDQLHLIGMDAARLAASYVVTADLDMKKATVQPFIGAPGTPFTGDFDGKGHTITGLSFLAPTDTGLFPETGATATLHDLTLAGVVVTSPNCNVGGLVGLNGGSVKAVHVDGHVSGTCSTGVLVGSNEMGAQIFGCSASGTVGVGTAIGGLVGTNDGAVVESWSTVDVQADKRVGGLVGGNSGTVQRSYATGKIVGNFSSGGLVGTLFAGSAITDSYSRCGSVVGGNEAGGFAGEVNPPGVAVTNCYVSCAVIGTTLVDAFIGKSGALATIVSSYWDSGKSPTGTSGMGVTTVALQSQTTFVGWDFQAVWKLDAAIAPSPVLAWQKP